MGRPRPSPVRRTLERAGRMMELMARGWESKAVEAQMEAAQARKGHSQTRLSPQQAEAARKLDSLLLHRTRVLRDLEHCRDERYRKTLSDGLAYLEAQLKALGWKG